MHHNGRTLRNIVDSEDKNVRTGVDLGSMTSYLNANPKRYNVTEKLNTKVWRYHFLTRRFQDRSQKSGSIRGRSLTTLAPAGPLDPCQTLSRMRPLTHNNNKICRYKPCCMWLCSLLRHLSDDWLREWDRFLCVDFLDFLLLSRSLDWSQSCELKFKEHHH